ncbi:MAG: tRNA (adenosine(37)-N6)-threonylcarbamoyltransferase complex ATPase subunit type 1 TsaE [Clostridia bacterium]|nr:tRNA (adenosine(37)-N6)-threonylcarbamoyltransferase complex ATPase subunit type 1 TsaE [Clostridia bacterium]
MFKFVTNTPEETENLAEKLAQTLKGGEIIAFKGSMGMGKTCFTRGLAKGLGFNGQVSSPTFAIVNEYLGGRLPLYHFDMYRIESWEDLYSCGYFDYMEMGGVIAAEWSENIENALEGKVITVSIEKISETKREIIISGEINEDFSH